MANFLSSRYIMIVILICYAKAAKAQQIDVIHYRYEIELTDLSDAITGKATIIVRFPAAVTRFSLNLASPEEGAGMQAFQVTEDRKTIPFIHRNNLLSINLSSPVKAGDVRRFEILYMGVPRDGLIISSNKFGDRTFFSDNWPNRAQHWIPCNDQPADKAAVDFIVTAPAHYGVVSNGVFLGDTVLQGGRKRSTWHQSRPIPTKVMVVGVARFAVKEWKNEWSTVPVSAWIYPQDSSRGFHDYALAKEVLSFFTDYIAPYPFAKLANVQSKTIFGGMENASAIFYNEASVTGTASAEALIAHEVAHQWFGNDVTEKSYDHLWLSEGFATYLTHLYIEKKYGRDSFRTRLENDRKEIIEFSKGSKQPVVDPVSKTMDLLNPNSYQKGSWVLHMLRVEVGGTLFKKIIQQFYLRHAGNNADSRDFQQVAESVSGKSLGDFFDQWLYQPGIPRIELGMKMDTGKIIFDIKRLDSTINSFPLKIRLTAGRDTLATYIIPIPRNKRHFKMTFDLKSVPNEIRVDPDADLLFQWQHAKVPATKGSK